MKQKIISFFFLLLTVVFGFTQDKREQKAEKEIENYAYYEAIETYESLIKKGFSDAEVFRNLGDANYMNAQYEEAISWYRRLFRLKNAKMDAETIYRYAQSLKSNGEYAVAEIWMNKLEAVKEGDARVEKFKDQQDYLIKIEDLSGRYTLKNLAINSSESDFAPSFFKENLVFASARDTGMVIPKINEWTNKSFSDLFMVKPRSIGKFSQPAKFSDVLNENTHETTTAFTKDGKTVYFTRNNSNKGKFSRDEKGVSRLKIYRAVLKDSEWTDITELPFNSDRYSVAHPALSPDERKLYFASDMKGTIGASDLFVVDILADGSFEAPINLGPKINTESRETFPFISQNNILYFASDGHPGLGGLDVFAADLTNPEDFQVKNIGKPVNGLSDDFSFIIDDTTKKGYFASNRKGGRGSDDIYAITENETVDYNCMEIAVKGFIKSQKTDEFLANVQVVLFDNESNIIAETFSGYEGKFILDGPCKGNDYNLVASKDGYERSEYSLSAIVDEKAKGIEIHLQKTLGEPQVGANLISYLGLQPIYFDLNQDTLRPDTSQTLEKIVAFMERFPELKIEVQSHTDAIASKNYNMLLSKRRAQNTVDFLIAKGITDSRIAGKGFGETQLINDCKTSESCTATEHQENRRSEFIVVE